MVRSRFSKLFLLLLIPALLSSCSSLVQKMAVGTTSGLLFNATYEIMTEKNWDLFKSSITGNIKMMEGLSHLEPGNTTLLAGLTKAYTGYAFTIDETEYLNDQLADRDYSKAKKQAIANFSKAIYYGFRFLEENGITRDSLIAASKDQGGLLKLLEDELDGDDPIDMEGVFFTAQAMASLINIQKDNMILVAQVPLAKGMFDWACGHNPTFNYGACDIFYGAYEAGRPKMMGGNPQKGKEIFEKAIVKYPHNWMIRAAYIQFYQIPMMDEDGFQEQKGFFARAKRLFDQNWGWQPGKKTPAEFENRELGLFQAIALKRYRIIKKYQNDIF